MTNRPEQIPVTILTGFLGSGKTTVLNHVLQSGHGKRIAVIENEFGEVGIDNELVFCAKDELFNMESGCVCCTVKPDLIRILGELVRREDRFDHIIIETSGLADPAPVAQTFFVDEDIKVRARLDAVVTVVTVVDAKHVLARIDQSRACLEQVAFADIVLINKCDLATPEEIKAVEDRVRAINSVARIQRTTSGVVCHEDILDQGGFNLDRALESKPAFLRDEYPFERAATYELQAGVHEIQVRAGKEGTLALTLIPANAAMRDLEARASGILMRAIDDEVDVARPEGGFQAGGATVLAVEDGRAARFFVDVPAAGRYVLFTQYGPDYFGYDFIGPNGKANFATEVVDYTQGHAHDASITSVSVTAKGQLDKQRIGEWLKELVKARGADIFRLKGILDVKGHHERFVVHGVHMRLDAKLDRAWRPEEARSNHMVFIGRNLDKRLLARGLRECKATSRRGRQALRLAS